MTVAAVLFAIAALGGVVLAVMRFRGKELPPRGLALLHGLITAAGLVALILVVVGGNVSTQTAIALAGFVIAALGGVLLFSFHLRRQALPNWRETARWEGRDFRTIWIVRWGRPVTRKGATMKNANGKRAKRIDEQNWTEGGILNWR